MSDPAATAAAAGVAGAATVHVVDDDAAMRKSLQMLLESASLRVRVYDSAEAFLEQVDLQRAAGCIVLDLHMGGMGGLELLRELHATRNAMPAIIISARVDVPAAVRGMKLGAVDLLQKPFEAHVILEAVRRAIDRGLELQRSRADEEAVRQRLSDLTPRERDLLKLIVAGRSNKQIAHDLHISIKTVANHRASLMAKTQALNAADLARISVIAGVLPTEQNRAT